MSTRAAANAGGEDVFGERKAFAELVINASISQCHDIFDDKRMKSSKRVLSMSNELLIRC